MAMTAGLLKALGFLSFVTCVGYAVLAALRLRLCWISGAVSAVTYGLVCAFSRLPMQAALQVFYVGMSVYGWWSWTRSSREGELPVGLWPLRRHLGAALALTVVSFASARLLGESGDAWPLLDSLTAWFSLLATWLAVRARLENWLYWIVIDGVLVYLLYVQDQLWLSLLNVALVGIAAGGFVAWRRRFLAMVPA